MSPAERAALTAAIDAQRKRLFMAGSILALLREVLDEHYAGDRPDAPDLSYSVAAVMCIVDRVAAELDDMAQRRDSDTPTAGGNPT